jgi:hypothetical protein
MLSSKQSRNLLWLTFIDTCGFVQSDPDSNATKVKYAELRYTWGRPTTSRDNEEETEYYAMSIGVDSVRRAVQTPPPQFLGAEWLQARNQLASSDVMTNNETLVNRVAENEPARSGAMATNENSFDITYQHETDPFYEPGDVPRLLPQGAEPREYLATFGYPPPPLFMINVKQRVTSPPDLGDSLFWNSMLFVFMASGRT